jgi:hypothetical protein
MSNNLAQFLLDRNQEQSKYFCEHTLARAQYRAKHPTEICALKCMDGRLNLSVMTKIPVGIIQPYRNIGGRFDFGWPYFGTLLRKWVEHSVGRGKDCLMLVTYHFSRGDVHRGCAGFGYDAEKAKEHTRTLISDFTYAFGGDVFYPIQVGIETDDEALVLHGHNNETFDVGQNLDMDHTTLYITVSNLYPHMKKQVILDLIPLLVGNQRHVTEIRKSNRPIIEASHKEQILAIGRGFNWLHLPNRALIIGPYSFDLGEPIELAARLLLSNVQEGRVPKEEGVLLMTSAVYGNEADTEYKQALFKARAFAKFALKIINERVPELMQYMTSDPLVGVVNYHTLHFTKISFKD